MTPPTGSDRFGHYLHWRTVLDDPFVELDLSCSLLTDADLRALLEPLAKAIVAMHELERGALANADERRMVGHYWLRAPGLAPDAEIEEAIARAVGGIEQFTTALHSGRTAPPGGGTFRKVVLCGIGGSALGPMLLGDVFGGPSAPTALHVLDNTDPDGIDRELRRIGPLRDAVCLVASKSGGTPETRNGMLELGHACRAQGLEFAPRAVAITVPGSALHERALREQWLAAMPIWDWVGGRTSITSAVGLLPGALLGMDVRAFLAGAAAMDEATRHVDPRHNPAAMLAVFWHVQGRGRGERAMVVLPYKDRLLLLSRYLQQLVMESLGKAQDRKGQLVQQGIAVYGNKGSTDQHAYVQQLRDGRHDFFATFVRVLRDREGSSVAVEPGVTGGDYLDGFWQGTRAALFEQGRASATIAVDALNERTLGAMVALFERAVGIYAELVDVNAYHQPGVEAGKKAAGKVLELQGRIEAALAKELRNCRAIAAVVGADAAECWPILCHLAANRADVVAKAIHEPEQAAFGRR